ncbi:hypothetical protein ACFLSJ_05700 [Verrucomicrobiota bacterium]
MKCETAERDILLAGTGELRGSGRDELESHLESCPRCRQYRQGVFHLGTAAREHLRAEGPDRSVLAAIRAAAEERHTGRVFFPGWPVARTLAYAAALALLVGVGVSLLPEPRTDRIGAIHDIMVMVSEEEDSGAEREAPDEPTLRALADQLLIMEGLAEDDLFEESAIPALREELPSTGLRSRSSSAPGRRRYV